MYLNVGYNSTEPVVLTMITSNVVTSMIAPSRTWKIRVSQIPCNEGYAGIFQSSLFQVSVTIYLVFSSSRVFAVLHRTSGSFALLQLLLRRWQCLFRPPALLSRLHHLHPSRKCIPLLTFETQFLESNS